MNDTEHHLHPLPATVRDPMPKVEHVTVTVTYSDGATGTIELTGATSATFAIDEDTPELHSSATRVIVTRRETLVLRFADPAPFAVAIPGVIMTP